MIVTMPCSEWRIHSRHQYRSEVDPLAVLDCQGVADEEQARIRKAIMEINEEARQELEKEEPTTPEGIAEHANQWSQNISQWMDELSRRGIPQTQEGLLQEMRNAASRSFQHLVAAEREGERGPMMALGWSTYGKLLSDIHLIQDADELSEEAEEQISLYRNLGDIDPGNELGSDGFERHLTKWVWSVEEQPTPTLSGQSFIVVRNQWECDQKWSDGRECATAVDGSPDKVPGNVVCRRRMPVDLDFSEVGVPAQPHVDSHPAYWMPLPDLPEDSHNTYVCNRRWQDGSRCTEQVRIPVGDHPMTGVPHSRVIPTTEVNLPEEAGS